MCGACRTFNRQHAQAGTEVCGLTTPIPNQRGRTNEQMRAGKGFHHRKGLNGLAEAHFISEQACCAGLGVSQKPERTFELIRPQTLTERAEGCGCRPSIRLRSLASPGGDTGLDISTLGFTKIIGSTLLRRVAVAKNLFQIGSQIGIGNGESSIRQTELGFSALKKALKVLRTENGLLPGGEMNVEIEPSIAAILESEARFEADNILGDMQETLALCNLPFLFEAWQISGKEADDRILTCATRLCLCRFQIRSRRASPGRLLRLRGFECPVACSERKYRLPSGEATLQI
jgi:hypothetical protein